MSQPPPPYGGDPNNPYGQQPAYGQQQPPPPDPYQPSGYQQPPTYTPPFQPDPYGYPMQYGAQGIPMQRSNGLALTSMICGIAGLVLMFFCGLGFLPAVAALITGFIARSQINQSGGVQGGSGQALAGIITGAAAIGLSILFIVLWLITGLASALINNGG